MAENAKNTPEVLNEHLSNDYNIPQETLPIFQGEKKQFSFPVVIRALVIHALHVWFNTIFLTPRIFLA